MLACNNVGGVECVSKFAVDLKLLRGVLPLLTIIVEHTLGFIVDNVESLQSTENGWHDRLSALICVDTLMKFE